MYLLLNQPQEPQLLYPQAENNNTELLIQALPFSCPSNIVIKQQLITIQSVQQKNEQKNKQYQTHTFSFPTREGTNCFGISSKINRYTNGFVIEAYIFLIFSAPVEKYFQDYLQFKIQQMEQNNQSLINLIKEIWTQVSQLFLPVHYQYKEQATNITQIEGQGYEINITEPLPQLQEIVTSGENISEIISALMSEQKVIITGDNREDISNFVEQILLLLNPTSYPGLYYYILPQKYLHVIQIPFQIFCGIELQLLKKAIVQPETLVYNLTEQQFMKTQKLADQEIDIRFVLPRQMLQQKDFTINLIYKQEKESELLLLNNTNNFNKTDNFIPKNINAFREHKIKKMFNSIDKRDQILCEKMQQIIDDHKKYRQVNYLHLLCPLYYNDQYFVKMIQFNERMFYTITSGIKDLENSSKISTSRKSLKHSRNNYNLINNQEASYSESSAPINQQNSIQQIYELYCGNKVFREQEQDQMIFNQLPYLVRKIMGQIINQNENDAIIPHPYTIIVYYMNQQAQNKQGENKVYEKLKDELYKLKVNNIIDKPVLILGAQKEELTKQQEEIISEYASKDPCFGKIGLKIGLQLQLFSFFQVYRKYLRQNIQLQQCQIQKVKNPQYDCLMSKQIGGQHQYEIIRELNQIIRQKIKKRIEGQNQQLSPEQIDVIYHQQKHKPYDILIDTKAFISGSLPLLQPFLSHFVKSIWWESFLEINLCQQINETQWQFNSYFKNQQIQSSSFLRQSPPSTSYMSIIPMSLTDYTKQIQSKETSSSLQKENESTFVYNEQEIIDKQELQYTSLFDQNQYPIDIISTYMYLFGPYQPLRIQNENNKSELLIQCYKQTENVNIWHKRDFKFTKIYESITIGWYIDKYKDLRGQLVINNKAQIILPDYTKDMPTQYCIQVAGRPQQNSEEIKKLWICFLNKYDMK